jgi:hypothetical protein
MDAYSILTDAITSKQQVIARYHDEERLFSPHALGTKRGVAHVLVYQYAGGSRTGLPPGGEWRCLNVEKLSGIRLEPGAWRTAENVFNPQTCLDEVEVLADPLPPRTTTRTRGTGSSIWRPVFLAFSLSRSTKPALHPIRRARGGPDPLSTIAGIAMPRSGRTPGPKSKHW